MRVVATAPIRAVVGAISVGSITVLISSSGASLKSNGAIDRSLVIVLVGVISTVPIRSRALTRFLYAAREVLNALSLSSLITPVVRLELLAHAMATPAARCKAVGPAIITTVAALAVPAWRKARVGTAGFAGVISEGVIAPIAFITPCLGDF